MAFRVTCSIDPNLIDTQYRHVDHAALFKLLEKGRLAFLEEKGFPNQRFIEQGLFLVIAELEARYLREVKEGPVTVTVDQFWKESKDLFMTQRLLNNREKECVQSRFRFRFLDGATKRSIEVPHDFERIISVTPVSHALIGK